MRADRIAGYRSALLGERARITGVSRKNREFLVVPGGTAVEDQAPLVHDQFVELRRRGMDRRKLKLIDSALERIESGEFGLCDECGEPIPAKRLNIVAWATYCVPCQDRVDARGDAEEILEMIA